MCRTVDQVKSTVLMKSFSFHQLVTNSTRIPDIYRSNIDHICISDFSMTLGVSIGPELGSSDHCSVTYNFATV